MLQNGQLDEMLVCSRHWGRHSLSICGDCGFPRNLAFDNICGYDCLFPDRIRNRSKLPHHPERDCSRVGAIGSSMAVIIYPIVFHELQPRIHFEWSVIGFIAAWYTSCPMRCYKAKNQANRNVLAFSVALDEGCAVQCLQTCLLCSGYRPIPWLYGKAISITVQTLFLQAPSLS